MTMLPAGAREFLWMAVLLSSTFPPANHRLGASLLLLQVQMMMPTHGSALRQESSLPSWACASGTPGTPPGCPPPMRTGPRRPLPSIQTSESSPIPLLCKVPPPFPIKGKAIWLGTKINAKAMEKQRQASYQLCAGELNSVRRLGSMDLEIARPILQG